jgi:type IV secretion system protein VirB11
VAQTGSAVNVYLDQALAPLQPFLLRDDVTDIHINRPGEIWVELLEGAPTRHDVPVLTDVLVDRLVAQVAAASAQGVNRANPLLSATLVSGARLQAVVPPATRGEIAVSIRKHRAIALRLTDYDQQAAFASVDDDRSHESTLATELARLKERGEYGRLLALAVNSRRNILVSGGTAT